MTKFPAAFIAMAGLPVDRRIGVDLEFTAERVAVGVIALGVDAVGDGLILVEALPGDDEVAGGIHRHGGNCLMARHMGVDLELPSHGVAVGVIALGVDAEAGGRILAETLPGDDEVAGGVHRHGRLCLGSSPYGC